MIQEDLMKVLELAGYPVAYHHFVNPPPKPPYLVYMRVSDDNISSDYLVHEKFKNYQVELYTELKEPETEQKVEAILGAIDADYTTDEDYIETEKLFRVMYQFRVKSSEVLTHIWVNFHNLPNTWANYSKSSWNEI